eukprot:m.145534 g.145534  ORF g.145534 m.145534 type:complete len:255 (-) comp17736_c0_seq1:661-1425(-)
MDCFNNIFLRCLASWEPTWTQLRAREETGAAWNAFDEGLMGWRFLAGANVFYFVMLYTLHTFMKNREPFSCSMFMKVYNLVCVVLAGSSAYYMARGKLIQTNFVCNINADGTEAGNLLMIGSKLFYAQKFWEYLDTFIFLLRKKSRQVTFLHIYHHSSITLAAAAYLTFDGNGDCYLSGLLNSSVHVLMYARFLIVVNCSEYSEESGVACTRTDCRRIVVCTRFTRPKIKSPCGNTLVVRMPTCDIYVYSCSFQ